MIGSWIWMDSKLVTFLIYIRFLLLKPDEIMITEIAPDTLGDLGVHQLVYKIQ